MRRAGLAMSRSSKKKAATATTPQVHSYHTSKASMQENRYKMLTLPKMATQSWWTSWQGYQPAIRTFYTTGLSQR
jgi:hypothetical protein